MFLLSVRVWMCEQVDICSGFAVYWNSPWLPDSETHSPQCQINTFRWSVRLGSDVLKFVEFRLCPPLCPPASPRAPSHPPLVAASTPLLLLRYWYRLPWLFFPLLLARSSAPSLSLPMILLLLPGPGKQDRELSFEHFILRNRS